jgi:hypothetical protein
MKYMNYHYIHTTCENIHCQVKTFTVPWQRLEGEVWTVAQVFTLTFDNNVAYYCTLFPFLIVFGTGLMTQ